MSMDLISGTIILTSVFLVVVGLTTLSPVGSADRTVARSEGPRRRKMVLTILLAVYFLGITNVLIITQQHNLAYLNVAVGIALAALQYFTGTISLPEGKLNASDRVEEVPSPSPMDR